MSASMLSSRDHSHPHHPHSVSMDYHPSDRRKRDHTEHDTFYTEPGWNSSDDDRNNNLNNKRKWNSFIDYEDCYDMDETPEVVDVLTSRRMRILIREKPWHGYVDSSAAFANTNTTTLSMREQKELEEFKDEQRNIQLQMTDEALNQWKEWCSLHSDPHNTSMSLKKLIDFIGTKVIPQENAILRQLSHDNRIPISGVESLLLPLLRHMYQEEKALTRRAPPSSHQRSPLMVSIRTGPRPSSVLSPSNPYAQPVLSRPSRSEYVTDVNRASLKVDSETETETEMEEEEMEEGEEEEEEEEEEASPWTSVRLDRDCTTSPSAVLDDVSCLENSLEIVSTISAEVAALCKSAHKPNIDVSESNPYLLTESFFARLRKDQVKAERLGLSGTLYNSLLVEVLEGHVQLAQTLSVQMSNRAMSLVPAYLAKEYAVSNIATVSSSLVPDLPLQTPLSAGLSSLISSKKPSSGKTFKTTDQDFAQSDASNEGPDQDQGTKVKGQIYTGCQDVDILAAECILGRSKVDSYDWNQINKGEAGEEGNRERTSEGSIFEETRSRQQEPSSLSEELTGIVSPRSVPGLTTEKLLDQLVSHRNSEVILTLAPSQAPLVTVEKPGPKLPFVSHVAQTQSIFSLKAMDIHSDDEQQTAGIDSAANRVVVSPIAPPLAVTSSVPPGPSHALRRTSSSAESSGGSSRLTLKALAAMNTTPSALGPGFTQWRTATQVSTDKPRGESRQTLPGSPPLCSPSSTIRSIQPIAPILPVADSALTSTPVTQQALPTTTNHQPTPQPSKLRLDQAPSFSSTSFGSPGSFFHPPTVSAAPAPSSRLSFPAKQASIQNYFTARSRQQQQPVTPLSQPHMPTLPQQQASSLPTSQAPTPLVQFVPRFFVQAQSGFTVPSSTAVTPAQSASSAPNPFNLADDQGAMARLDNPGSLDVSSTSNAIRTTFNGVFQSASKALPVSYAPTPHLKHHATELLNDAPTTLNAHVASSIAAHILSFAVNQQATPSAAPISTATTVATATTATTTPTVIIPPTTAPQQILAVLPSQTLTTGLLPPPVIVAATQVHGTAVPQVPRISDTTTFSAPSSSATLVFKPRAINQPVSASSTTIAADGQEQVQLFRLSFELQTVFDIWDLWTLGIQGSPSVADLIEKHRMTWLHPADRETFRDYRSVLLIVERTVRQLKLDVRVGLAQLEHVRVKFKMSVRQFAKILTEVDMGKAAPFRPSSDSGSLPPSSSLHLSMALPMDPTPETMRAFVKAINAITLHQPSFITTTTPHS